MPHVLVAEDSPTQARQIQFLLQDAQFDVEITSNGLQALHAMEQAAPDVVLTDLEMPEKNGLELVQAIRSRYPFVPVVLMTAHGSEEIAAQALQQGAASYIPKRRLARDVVNTLEKIIALAQADAAHHRVLDCITDTETSFLLTNDPSLIPPLVAHLREALTERKFCDDTSVIQVGVALQEALDNAIYHGNLELSSELQQLSKQAFAELAEKRRMQPPYRYRSIHFTARISRSEAGYVVKDEGPGFDPARLPDPKDPAALESSGRGLALIRTFMDEVHYNQKGTEITMVKRRA